MNRRDRGKERATLENALKRNVQEFTGAYLAVCDLRELVRTHPGLVTTETIQVLRDLLFVIKRNPFSSQGKRLIPWLP